MAFVFASCTARVSSTYPFTGILANHLGKACWTFSGKLAILPRQRFTTRSRSDDGVFLLGDCSSRSILASCSYRPSEPCLLALACDSCHRPNSVASGVTGRTSHGVANVRSRYRAPCGAVGSSLADVRSSNITSKQQISTCAAKCATSARNSACFSAPSSLRDTRLRQYFVSNVKRVRIA